MSEPEVILAIVGVLATTVSSLTVCAAHAITTSGFTAKLNRTSNNGDDPGMLGNTDRYVYSWIAIGTKAR